MNHRFLSLALAGALSLTLLAGCGGNGESVAPSEEVTPPQTTESAQPSESPLPSESLQPEESEEPSENVTPSDAPETPSAQATAKPSAKPTAKPTTKPSAAPTPTPAADASSVLNSVWTDISKQEMPALIDLDSATLLAVYGLDSSNLDAYICKMPMMNTKATEFFLAKVKDGKMDAVKAAVEKRQEDLEQQWSQYLPDQLDLVKNYKLVTNGNYILFVVSEYADAAVTAFNTYTK